MNWMKFGWGRGFDSNFNPSIPFFIDLTNKIQTSKSLLEISQRVIDEIIEKYPPPYYLMVSGGMDSQLMLWCWINSGIDFVPISVKYTGCPEFKKILNEHDLIELDDFAKNRNINIKYKYFDIISFLENNLETYAVKYQCTSPQICTHMKMSEMITDGTVIFSGNFATGLSYSYTIWGLKRYAEVSRRSIIPFFFLHDAELANLPVIPTNEEKYSDIKFSSYNNLGAPVIPQPKKQTGFEIIKDYYDTRTDLVVPPIMRLKYAHMPSKRKFDLLFRYSLMEKIKYIDEVVYIRTKQQ
jgi:hypothetical protein